MVSQRSPFISRTCGETEDPEGASLPLSWLQQGVHKELKPEGPQEDSHEEEAAQVPMGWMRPEVCQVVGLDKALQEAYRLQALRVPPLQTGVLA